MVDLLKYYVKSKGILEKLFHEVSRFLETKDGYVCQNEMEHFYYVLLDRIQSNSIAIANLIDLLKHDSKHKVPLSLILRGVMSDVLTYFYLKYWVKKDKVKIANNEVKAINAEALRAFKETFKEEDFLYKQSKDSFNIQERYHQLLDMFPDYHDKDENLIKPSFFRKKFEDTKEIGNMISEKKKYETVKLSNPTLAMSFISYKYFSQFYHVSDLHHNMKYFTPVENMYYLHSIEMIIIISGELFGFLDDKYDRNAIQIILEDFHKIAMPASSHSSGDSKSPDE